MSRPQGIVFDSGPYWREHGHAPRGRGYWMFCPRGAWDRPDYLDHCVNVPGPHSLREAKAKLRAMIGPRPARIWVVCP